MMIGERLKQLREQKKFSQGDLEVRTGLLRCYTSRVENGHTVPAIETLEKYAKALEIPLYVFFIEPGAPAPKKPYASITARVEPGDKRTAAFRRPLEMVSERSRRLLLSMARVMARQDAKKSA